MRGIRIQLSLSSCSPHTGHFIQQNLHILKPPWIFTTSVEIPGVPARQRNSYRFPLSTTGSTNPKIISIGLFTMLHLRYGIHCL
jgi:hypothetical protein